ncbi:MAG TPA: DUF2180 family protein [Ktedonobacteraceae bacterium]|nr:DUF2180 family protein [Ktedonobacteraceae bacterium]
MYCYACFLETGCDSSPALAICQRCGAGICRAHLVELTVPPVIGPGGEARSMLICRRCVNLSMTRLYGSNKRSDEQCNSSRRGWWRWFRQHPPSPLPTPEEAVESVEQFLHHQQSQ